ncbi:MAG: hypothetical protein Q3962_07215 [Corynebacterium sp.]|nr:hypothetical protein [Corynebacterium sp.]
MTANLVIADKVFEKIARRALLDTPCVVSKAINFARDYPHVSVSRDSESLRVDGVIAVTYPSPVALVALAGKIAVAKYCAGIAGERPGEVSVTVDSVEVQGDGSAYAGISNFEELDRMIQGPVVKKVPKPAPLELSEIVIRPLPIKGYGNE